MGRYVVRVLSNGTPRHSLEVAETLKKSTIQHKVNKTFFLVQTASRFIISNNVQHQYIGL